MKKIAIVGSGGFGKEIAFLIERTGKWEIIGFFDDNEENTNKKIYGYDVIGSITDLVKWDSELAVVCAIGSSEVRKKVIDKIKPNLKITFPTVIDPSVIMGKQVQLGEGNIICANSILTVDIDIGNFNTINLNTTIGHDVQIKSFNTFYPTVNISGFIEIDDGVEVGTGSQIIQNLKIGKNAIIGAGSVVVKDVPPNTTSVGAPAKVIKTRKEV